MQAQYSKLEDEKTELEKRLVAVTQERNSLETRLAELEDRSRYVTKILLDQYSIPHAIDTFPSLLSF